MSLLAALTVKVSAILLLVLAAALCLRTRSAAARHWVLAVGVVAACGAPALHVLPVPPVVRVAPLGAFDWSADTVFDLLGLRPYALFTADTDVLGSAVASETAGSRRGRSGRAVAAVASGHVVGWIFDLGTGRVQPCRKHTGLRAAVSAVLTRSGRTA